MLERNTYITVDVAGLNRVQFLSNIGDIGTTLVLMSARDATTVMNCASEGYWGDVNEGLIVEWEISHGSSFVKRIIEVSSRYDKPIEYVQVPHNESDLAFMINANQLSGGVSYVGDFMAESPFETEFSKARLVWFNSLVGLDKIIQRGYVANIFETFHGMWHNGRDRDLHIVWAKIKD